VHRADNRPRTPRSTTALRTCILLPRKCSSRLRHNPVRARLAQGHRQQLAQTDTPRCDASSVLAPAMGPPTAALTSAPTTALLRSHDPVAQVLRRPIRRRSGRRRANARCAKGSCASRRDGRQRHRADGARARTRWVLGSRILSGAATVTTCGTQGSRGDESAASPRIRESAGSLLRNAVACTAKEPRCQRHGCCSACPPDRWGHASDPRRRAPAEAQRQVFIKPGPTVALIATNRSAQERGPRSLNVPLSACSEDAV
jgi:hypothetical protein